MERIWPVLTSMTTAVPLTAFEVSIALASACSDSYWSCGVERQLEAGARHGGRLVGDRRLRQRHPGGRLHDGLLAVRARQQAGCRRTRVRPHPGPHPLVKPDHGCRQVPVGHHPLGVGEERDPGDGVGGDLLADRLGKLAGQDDVARVLVQLGGQGRRGHVQQRRQREGGLDRVGDLEVVGHDVVGRHRQRQRRPVAGVDPAADGRQRDRDGGLPAGRGRVGAGMEHLDVDEASHQEQQGHDEDEAHQSDPALEGTAGPRSPRARERQAGYLCGRSVRLCVRLGAGAWGGCGCGCGCGGQRSRLPPCAVPRRRQPGGAVRALPAWRRAWLGGASGPVPSFAAVWSWTEPTPSYRVVRVVRLDVALPLLERLEVPAPARAARIPGRVVALI